MGDNVLRGVLSHSLPHGYLRFVAPRAMLGRTSRKGRDTGAKGMKCWHKWIEVERIGKVVTSRCVKCGKTKTRVSMEGWKH